MPAWLLDRPNKDGCFDYMRLTWNLRPTYLLGSHQAQTNYFGGQISALLRKAFLGFKAPRLITACAPDTTT